MTDPCDCVICRLYRPHPYTAHHGQACDSCQVRSQTYLNAIRNQYALLDATPGGTRAEHVSGGETGLGVRIGVLDLITRSRTHAPATRDHLGDQEGHLPVTTVLHLWAQDWVDQRGRGEHLPHAEVPDQITWFTDRLDWAWRYHSALADFVDEMRCLSGILAAATGDVTARPEHKAGVPCQSCDYMSLYRHAGEELIDCAACGRSYTAEEYLTWVSEKASEVKVTGST